MKKILIIEDTEAEAIHEMTSFISHVGVNNLTALDRHRRVASTKEEVRTFVTQMEVNELFLLGKRFDTIYNANKLTGSQQRMLFSKMKKYGDVKYEL